MMIAASQMVCRLMARRIGTSSAMITWPSAPKHLLGGLLAGLLDATFRRVCGLMASRIGTPTALITWPSTPKRLLGGLQVVDGLQVTVKWGAPSRRATAHAASRRGLPFHLMAGLRQLEKDFRYGPPGGSHVLLLFLSAVRVAIAELL